ncbi:MAG: hypothetical protein IJZ13_04300 [Clostridia bacterium]|nr:hypothetical protein [Clostridia bacterium]
MSERCFPISTEVGFLQGRDCIFLDTVMQKGCELTLSGELSGALVNKERDWIPYTFIFYGVIAYRSCELDAYLYSYEDEPTPYSFVQVKESRWIAGVSPQVDKNTLCHYRVYTYDYVYDIMATGYEMDIH